MIESYRDKLNEIDHKCINEDLHFYDLRSLFEAVAPKLSAQDKEEVKKVIQNTDDAETIAAVLMAKAKDDKNESLEESFYVHDQSLVDDWIEQDLTFDIEQDGVYSFANANESRKALKTAISHGYRDAWRETNKVYISGDKVNESLEENLVEDIMSREEYEKEREELAKKFNELRRNKVPSYDYRYKDLLKQEKELNKLGREIKAYEIGGEVFNKAKLTKLIKKLTGLDTLKTYSTAIRGYNNIGSGSFTITPEGQNSFRLSFYRNSNIQDEVKTKLIDLGFNVSEFGGDLLIDDIQIPKNESLEESLYEKLVDAPQEVVDSLLKILQDYGFILDPSFKVNPGKTFMGNIHMQVINPESIIEDSDEIDVQDELQKYVTRELIDEIHNLDQEYNCPITWNFGPNNKGQVTGGLDIMKQYVEESLKENLDISQYNQLSSTIKDAGNTYAIFRKLENGKGKWAAAPMEMGDVKYDDAFEITYDQARGFEPINNIGKLSRDLGKILLPQRESMNEASYGGAYDIEDDMYFTKEELMEFAGDLAEQYIAWSGHEKVYIEDLYIIDNHLIIELYDDNDGVYHSSDIKIDMRRIKLPKDIYKYSDDILNQWKNSYNEYHEYDDIEEKLTEEVENFDYDEAVHYIESKGISADPTTYVGEYVCDLLDDLAGDNEEYSKQQLDYIVKRAIEIRGGDQDLDEAVNDFYEVAFYLNSAGRERRPVEADDIDDFRYGDNLSEEDLIELFVDLDYVSEDENYSLEDCLASLESHDFSDGGPIIYQIIKGNDIIYDNTEYFNELYDEIESLNSELEESISVDDDVPYTYEQMEADLKSGSNNWTADPFEGWVMYEEEFDHAMQILSKHYENVKRLRPSRIRGFGFLATRPSLFEDTVKQNGKWVNKGKEGTHGTFGSKKAADDQRKAMFANGYGEVLNEAKNSIKIPKPYSKGMSCTFEARSSTEGKV